MQIRNLMLGGAVGVVGTMAIALTAIGIVNIEKERLIDYKKSELIDTIYPAIPHESRILTRPTGPALPSPGYQN